MNLIAQNLPPAPEVFQIEVGMMQNFCEILFCPKTRDAAVVDPAWEVDRLLREAKRLGVEVTKVLLTHTHNDHIEGLAAMVDATGAVTFVHPNERARIEPMAREIQPLSDGLDIPIGECGVRALEMFGHTVGGCCFLADGFIVTGDVLFVQGCGRTDLKGGDTATLWRSLQRVLTLPEETRVYPGHNYGPTPTSTISQEAMENRFLLCRTLDEFAAIRDRR